MLNTFTRGVMMISLKQEIAGIFLAIAFIVMPCQAFSDLFLKDKMLQAKEGDYVVATINNCYNILVVRNRVGEMMTIEEITIPAPKLQLVGNGWRGWKNWVESGAPGYSTWALYKIHLPSGRMQEAYSYTNNSWGNVSTGDNFLSKLLSLRLTPIPSNELKKVGPKPPKGAPDRRQTWQPQMYFEGNPVQGVEFGAWRTQWPADNTDLSKKVIIVYLPKDDRAYPSYFPYWLQVHGWTGKAKVHIVDSGRNMKSPQLLPSRY